MLVSFEEMVLRCESENSRSHIREAIRCYEAGAYRASIVATYVAVCFDLIEKLRVLAAADDKEAASQIEKLERFQLQQERGDRDAIKGLLEFERGLLEVFQTKLGFLGTHEYTELKRLREDRNRCAHPTFDKSSVPFNASAELARTHIRSAVEHVLSQAPKQGKVALTNLRAIVLSSLFPTDPDQVTARLLGTEVMKGKEALVRAFIDDLMFGVANPTSPYHDKLAVHWVLKSLLEIRRPEAEPRILKNLNKMLASSDLETNKQGCMAALWMTELGEQIDPPLRTVVGRWLDNEDLAELGPAIAYAMRISWLKIEAVALIEKLGYVEIGNMKTEGMPAEFVSRAARIYAAASSWDEANAITTKCVLPLASAFTDDDIEVVLKGIDDSKADLLGSHGFKNFVIAVHKAGNVDINSILAAHKLERFQVSTS